MSCKTTANNEYMVDILFIGGNCDTARKRTRAMRWRNVIVRLRSIQRLCSAIC
jgi:hypothetical protein